MDYASPEVRAGAAFSAASDVYALGLLLYRLLTGRRPFPVSGGEPTPPRKVCLACPRGLEGLLLAMLNPSLDMRPGLGMVVTTLDDEQAEYAADLAERAGSDAPLEDAGPPMSIGEQAIAAAPVPAADIVTVVPAAVFVAATETAAGAATVNAGVSRGGHDVAARPAPDRRSRWAVSLWMLGLTAAVGIALGRATVTRNEADADREATAVRVSPTSGAADEPGDVVGDAEVCDEPPPVVAVDDAPPAPPSTGQAESKRDRAVPQPRRHGAVTPMEAMTAAQRAMPSLRTCQDMPRVVTADLEIVRGRGVVTALNLHAPAPDDPRYPWHACAKQGLEAVRFPVRETAGHARVRLTLR
jgi:hypothetical protein